MHNPENSLSQCRSLRIGDAAPEFRARTTRGEVALSDYRGRWLVFFSHPADFTPVCTTEFVALAKAADKFAEMDCALLGLSVDSLYSHIAWVKAMKQAFGVSVDFPIVEDPSMAVGRAYGMIDETTQDSSSIRSSYFIDPDGIVRAITTYPYNVGRNVDEMLRIVAALQRADRDAVLTPEGWRPGDAVLVPPADTIDAASDMAEWFCRTEER
ncbi:MAG: peroxiredoxin [Sphingobium sp.]|nr:peroxiredoxin [Sphingobium sp.]MCP5397888.1 peroxiredoxin [Sphingomonas sp.]